MLDIKEIISSGNLAISIMKAADLHGDRVAQIFKSSDGEYNVKRTYGELKNLVKATCYGLKQIGFEPGGTTGIYASTHPLWNVCDLAALCSGGTVAGIYTNDAYREVTHKINDAGIDTVFVDTEARLETILSIPPENVLTLKRIISFCTPKKAIKDKRYHSFSEISAQAPDGVLCLAAGKQFDSNTLAKIIYTLGADGIPRGAMLSHKNLLANIAACYDLLDIRPTDTCLCHLPTAHALQSMISNLSLISGATLAYIDKKSFINDLPKIRPTIIPGVPKVFSKIVAAAEVVAKRTVREDFELGNEKLKSEYAAQIVKALGLDRTRMCISGAAKLDAEVATKLEYELDIPILEGYGMSETSPVISVNTFKGRKPGTVGKPVPGLEVVIVDDEGIPVQPGAQGEITVRGDSVFSGYKNMMIMNRRIFSPEGFFYTGDIGHFDYDGFLVISGRKGSKVKFANGEYYDLSAAAKKYLKRCIITGQVVIAGEQMEYSVALLTLSEDLARAEELAGKLGITYKDPYELAYNEKIIEAVKNEFMAIRENPGALQKMETPQKAIYLRPFSPTNREATATGQARLKKILSKYSDDISRLYDIDNDFVVLKMDRYDRG